jgi:hypothetical protein
VGRGAHGSGNMWPSCTRGPTARIIRHASQLPDSPHLLREHHAVCCRIPETCIERVQLVGGAADAAAPPLLQHQEPTARHGSHGGAGSEC